MTAARALIAIPLPPTSSWRLLRHESELPAGYVAIGELTVGREELPRLTEERSAKRQRAEFLAELDALLTLYRRMDVAQRRQLIEYARSLQTREAWQRIPLPSAGS